MLREIAVIINLNNVPENLEEDWGENEAISWLAERWVDRNNIESFRSCNELSYY